MHHLIVFNSSANDGAVESSHRDQRRDQHRVTETLAAPLMLLIAFCALLLVPVRCLGQTRPSNRQLVVALSGTNDVKRIAAIHRIGVTREAQRTALPDMTEAMAKLASNTKRVAINKRDENDLPAGVLQLINCIGTIDSPVATESLVNVFTCDRDSWIAAAALSLGSNQRTAAITAIEALTEHPAYAQRYGFRFAVAKALVQMDDPRAWDALAMIADQTDGQLQHLMNEAFKQVTLEQFDDDAPRFARWQARVGIDVESPELLGPNPEQPEPQTDTIKLVDAPSESSSSNMKLVESEYYGIPIYAKRLLFLVDCSGSMAEAYNGRIRMQQAKAELIEAIELLEPSTEFSILAYNERIDFFQHDLVQATEENKYKATSFVRKLKPIKNTDIHGALRAALVFDSQVEAVFLLSDGRPTAGRLTAPAAILQDILSYNRFHNLTFNSIGVGVESEMRSFLQKLAEPSDGEFRLVQ